MSQKLNNSKPIVERQQERARTSDSPPFPFVWFNLAACRKHPCVWRQTRQSDALTPLRAARWVLFTTSQCPEAYTRAQTKSIGPGSYL
jgi:hypothetical protein